MPNNGYLAILHVRSVRQIALRSMKKNKKNEEKYKHTFVDSSLFADAFCTEQ